MTSVVDMIPDTTPRFEEWPKIPRLNRDVIITEKIDGTNAQLLIEDERIVAIGSRKRWITPEQDNFGFARWARTHEDFIVQTLGEGRHYGEWWGRGIQRGYDLDHRRFSVFNSTRYQGLYEEMSDGKEYTVLTVVPILSQFTGFYLSPMVKDALVRLENGGSAAAPGYMKPEGIVIYHTQGNLSFKATIEGDDAPKGQQ